MAKEEIKNLLENSKKSLDQEYEKNADKVRDELESFKKKTLQKI